MDKFVGYLNLKNRQEGKPQIAGPVVPDPDFSPEEDLGACRDLCQLESAQCEGLGSLKRKRSGDGEGQGIKGSTRKCADAGMFLFTTSLCLSLIHI